MYVSSVNESLFLITNHNGGAYFSVKFCVWLIYKRKVNVTNALLASKSVVEITYNHDNYNDLFSFKQENESVIFMLQYKTICENHIHWSIREGSVISFTCALHMLRCERTFVWK